MWWSSRAFILSCVALSCVWCDFSSSFASSRFFDSTCHNTHTHTFGSSKFFDSRSWIESRHCMVSNACYIYIDI